MANAVIEGKQGESFVAAEEVSEEVAEEATQEETVEE
jgi:hypothetical protein